MLKNKKTVISMATALCAFALVGGVSAINANAETTLNGFTYAGVSVNAEEVAARFQFNLVGDAAAKKDLTAGVVYMPVDLYEGDYADFTLETEGVATAPFAWEETETANEYVGYSYLQASAIPANMYNCVLLVRGYVEDGETVYYTEVSKSSMAYSAWRALEDENFAEYEDTLKTYMGPYTLTSAAGNVENVYYGDTFYAELPTAYEGKNIAKWFWDAEKTVEVAESDYATGSMPVYYEYEKFAVSGVVDGGNETVEIFANGVKVGNVAANGEYIVWLEAGEYDFRFANDTMVAYATANVTAATEVNATLVSNKWEATNTYGNSTYTAPTYTKTSELDGSFDVEGASYDLIFPNTATTNAFSYEASITIPSGSSHRNNIGAGISVVCGAWRVTMVGYLWGQMVVSLSAGSGFAFNTIYVSGSNFSGTFKMQIVRTADKIEFYAHNRLMLTFTKGNVVANVTNANWGDTLTGNLANMNGFFAENAKIAVGVAGLRAWDAAWDTCPATFNLSMQEFATVNGTVALPEGTTLDLTNTTVNVGSVQYPMTVDAEGNFTAYIPEGTQTLEFKNGTWGATAADQVIVLGETNTVNVTLADYAWAPGTFGSRISNMTYDPADALDGNFTVSNATNKGVIFPNLATTGNFTYAVSFSNVKRNNEDGAYGILLTDGNWTFQVALKRWEPVLTNFCEGYGYAINDQWNPTADSGYNGGTLKFIRTSEKIEVYYNANLYFTLTATTFTANGFDLLWDGTLDCPSAWASIGANFFSTTKPITVGLVTLGECTGFTANCSFTNN